MTAFRIGGMHIAERRYSEGVKYRVNVYRCLNKGTSPLQLFSSMLS